MFGLCDRLDSLERSAYEVGMSTCRRPRHVECADGWEDERVKNEEYHSPGGDKTDDSSAGSAQPFQCRLLKYESRTPIFL